MSLHADLRRVDRRRAVRLLASWSSNDREAVDAVLAETADDPAGTPGLLFAVVEYADWVTTHTGPLVDQDGDGA